MKRIIAALFLFVASAAHADWPASNDDTYFAEAFGSGRGGVEAAVNAACAAGGGVVVMPAGTISIAAGSPINLDCDYVELVGSYYGTILSVASGGTGVLVTGDWVTMRDFRITMAASNAANVGIDMDNNASTVSRWTIDSVRMIGNADTGKGVRCELCQKGQIENSQISDFEHGFYGTSTPNNNTFTSSTFNLNDYGIYIADTMSSTVNLIGSAFESNDLDGVYCVSAGAGIVVSHGSHFESNANGFHRPASGCGFMSIGDTFSANTDDYLKESSGGTDDIFIGPYFSAGSINNAGSEVVPILFPTNSSLVLPLDSTDAIIMDELGEIPTVGGTASSTAITNTTTEAAFDNCDNLSVAANTLSIGATIRITAGGIISTAAAAPGTIAFRVRSTAANTGPLLVDMGLSPTLATSLSSDGWRVQADVTVRTLGASGTAVGTGAAVIANSTADASSITLNDQQSGTTTIDTTAAIVPTLFADWGTNDVANTITAEYCTVEVIRQ